MKKIPTLFIREFENNKIVNIKNEVVKGMEWVLNGEGIATVKIDGTCCLIKDNEIYARFDYKKGRKLPDNAIPCQDEADELTGHFPHWVKVEKQPQYKYHKEAFKRLIMESFKISFINIDEVASDPDNIRPIIDIKFNNPEDGTYELIGPHFNKNKEKVEQDILIKHGTQIVEVERTFEGIKEYLKNNKIEGLVFWKDGIPQCKIKRSDFGFEW